MSDTTVIMVGPSTICALLEFKITKVVNEVLDSIMPQRSSGDYNDFNDDYSQLMTLGTHTISSNDSVNCDDCKEV
jgi:hypothetical protein